MCAPPPARGTVNSSPRVRTDPRPPNGQDRQVSARVHRRTHSRPPETRPYACADWPAPWPDPTRSEDQPPINVHTTYVRHKGIRQRPDLTPDISVRSVESHQYRSQRAPPERNGIITRAVS